jgi:hypothetical protein
VPHDDRRSLERADRRVVCVDDFFDAEVVNRAGVLAKLLEVHIHARPRWCEHLVATSLEALDPMLPDAQLVRSSRVNSASKWRSAAASSYIEVSAMVYPWAAPV